MTLPTTLEAAKQMDQDDPLRSFREQFFLPHEHGKTDLYLVGNSLGLQPKSVPDYLQAELETWQRLGVRGHFTEPRPWLNYHALLSETIADLVGANEDEVVVMNTLTVNLHLMMATFYRPSNKRNKIMIEAHAFPSDKNAVESQIRLQGYSPEESLIELTPDQGGELFSTEAVCDAIRTHRDSLALILLPGVQYYTGQVFDIQAITAVAHECGVTIGFDLAHAAGNVSLALHDWNVDFACWCTYKYLNSGPGSMASCFVHRRHATNTDLPRMAGWWGHDEATRFKMSGEFSAIATAEGWQLSNPPILSLAAIRASLDVFKSAGGMNPLVEKSRTQHQFFRSCLADRLSDSVQVIAPADCSGCQLSLQIAIDSDPQANSGVKPDHTLQGRDVYHRLESAGARTDWREPNVIRAAPVPLYNSFEEIWRFVDTLATSLNP